jgi:RimJ/RimL family protein N-acetyltransferase
MNSAQTQQIALMHAILYRMNERPTSRTAPRQRMKRRRLGTWRELIRLANGREVLLRPIEPRDAEPLRAGFTTLSAEEVRMRFLHPLKEITPTMALNLTTIDPRREFALVTAEPLPPGEALIGGVVRVSIDPNGRDAEFAILVARPVAGMGLGRHMMRRMLDWARRRGLETVYGNVLLENEGMLRLADSLGFERAHQLGDQGLVRITRRLRKAEPRPD